jgi:hypothetical protein
MEEAMTRSQASWVAGPLLASLFVWTPALTRAADAPSDNPGAGEASATPEASPTPATDEQKDATTLDAIFGQTVGSDYVAKHFSLIFGAVVLNPFAFTKVTPTPTTGQDEFTLNTGGDTKVRAFLEGGVRYRWAWLDRVGIGVIPSDEGDAHVCQNTKGALKDATRGLEIATGLRDGGRIKDLEEDIANRQKKLSAPASEAETKATRNEIADKQRELRDVKNAVAVVKAAEARAAADTRRYYNEQWRLSQEGTPVQILCSIWVRRKPIPSHCPDDPVPPAESKACPDKKSCFRNDDWDLQWMGSRCFLPGDFQVRVGYVFDGGSPSGVASLASNSNVYGDLIGGVNLVRASLPTGSPDETPVRASLNLEGLVSMTTDTNTVDVHSRYLIGMGAAVGVPLLLVPQATPKATEKAGESDGASQPAPTPKPGGIVEMVARLGAVNVDVPHFKNGATREVDVKNGEPEFSGQWGLGLDLELNVPIAEKMGYIVARASINEFITPSPWGIQVGYTIPLSTLVGFATPSK